MASLYDSLDNSIPHVKLSNGFIQIMKFNSSSDEEEDVGDVVGDEQILSQNEENKFSSNEEERLSQNEDSNQNVETRLNQNEERNLDKNKDSTRRSLLSEERQNENEEDYTECEAADLDQLYAVVDKSKTRQGKSKLVRKKLEMEVEIFRDTVSFFFIELLIVFFLSK